MSSDNVSYKEVMDGERSVLVDSLQLARESRFSPGYGSIDTNSSSFKSENRSSVFTLDDFDQFPVYANCPTCHKNVLTHVEHKASVLTWTLCLILFMLCCWCGVCLIPLCLKSCKDVIHHCPDCKTELGRYKRI